MTLVQERAVYGPPNRILAGRSEPGLGPVTWSGGAHRHVPVPQLTWGCVASILGIEVGEASRRCRNVAKEPAHL